MTVHVLIPVFNRLAMTEQVIACLRQQILDQALKIIVIDDGSTDGTAAYLAAQPDITTLPGDGNLWWGGAIEAGLQAVLRHADPDDHVLFINNDTRFDNSYVQGLVNLASANAPAAVGSVICDEQEPDAVLSIGPMLDTWRLRISDKLAAKRPRMPAQPPHRVDALSGRGTLYPIRAFAAAGTMKVSVLPHYMADYELAVRVKHRGYALLVSEDVVVLSADDYGNARPARSLWQKFFSIRSPYYIPAVLQFWWSASPDLFQRLTIMPRMLYTQLANLRKSP